jgi:hypothetical protein
MNSCEEAKEPVCVCRCGGLLHGIGHGKFNDIAAGIIEENGCVTLGEIREVVNYLLEEEGLESGH